MTILIPMTVLPHLTVPSVLKKSRHLGFGVFLYIWSIVFFDSARAECEGVEELMSKYPSMSARLAFSIHTLQDENRALAKQISISTLGSHSFVRCYGSGSVCCWSTRIWILINTSDHTSLSLSNNIKKTFIPTVL